MAGLFAVALAVVFARAVQLELAHGDAFRAQAATTRVRDVPLVAVRGSILDRHGVVLAEERTAVGLSLPAALLELPPDPARLRREARARLPRGQRDDAARLAEMTARIGRERQELHARLAALVGLSAAQWRARLTAAADRGGARSGFGTVAADLPLAAVEEIRRQPSRFPGVRLVEQRLRIYPGGTSAAHLLGHLGPSESIQAAGGGARVVGRLGLEQAFEASLAGVAGSARQRTDRLGRVLASVAVSQPARGSDLTLTLDARLQHACEAYLDAACRRRATGAAAADGGAVVVLDARCGELLALASSPRFDPNLFALDEERELGAVLADPARPLFDRAARMALPPGSLFKVVSALALLDSRTVEPQTHFDCQGYLDDPDRHRCQVFRQRGYGHGPIALADALAQSCNCYFFRFARESGPAPLVEWAQRLGLGSRTGVELPGEAAGLVPTPADLRRRRGRPWSDEDTLATAIGQGELLASPLQIARLMAAVANGGKLVSPRLVAAPAARAVSATTVPIDSTALAAVREGLRRAVADPEGTAFGSLDVEGCTVAGKTGTAQTGLEGRDHAWFAGYLPADDPRWVVVVALEHGGNSSASACPLARKVVEALLRTPSPSAGVSAR